MAEQIAYLEAIVGADITSFRQSMRTVRNDIGGLGKAMDGIASAGRAMTFAVTAPLALLSGAAVKSAASFEASMRNINSIAHLTEEQLKALTAQTLEFGSTTRSGPQKVAEALYEVYSAGKVGAEAFEIMAVSVKTAEAGLADLSKTTNAITATVTAFSKSGITAAEASNIWTRMVGVGVGELEEFLQNSQKVLPTAAAMGLEFQNIGQAAAYISQQGGGARKAMTGLGMLMSNLLKPNETLAEAYKKLGVVTGIDLVAKFGTLEDALMAIRGVTDDKTFFKSFSKTGMEAALALTNNFDAFKASVEEFNDGLGIATQQAWEQQMMSFAAQWDMMKAAVSSLAIVLGNVLMPILLPVISFIRDVALELSRANPVALKLAVTIGILVAAIGPLLMIIGNLLNPISLIITAITTLSAAWANNWGNIRTTVEKIVTDILGPLDEIKAGVDEFMRTLFGDGQEAGTTAGAASTKPITIPIGMQIEIKKGDTIWDIWDTQFREQFPDWPAFRDMVYEQLPGGAKGTLLPGQTITIPVATEIDLQLAGGQQFGSKFMLKNMGEGVGATQFDSFWERLGAAISGAWTKIQPGISTAFDNLKNWITNTAIPGLDDIAGSGISLIAGLFDTTGSTGQGDSPVYNAVRGLLSGGIGKALGDMGGFFQENFPQVSRSLKEFFGSLGDWILNEGLPTLFHTLGYVGTTIAIRIGQAIGEGIRAIGNFIGGGGVGDTANVIGESVADPFAQGVKDALADIPDLGTPLEAMATAIAGAFGSVLIVNILMSGISGGFTKAFLSLKVTGFFAASVLGFVWKVVDKLLFFFGFKAIGSAIMGKIVANFAGARIAGVALMPFADALLDALKSPHIWAYFKILDIRNAIGKKLLRAFEAISGAISWIKGMALHIMLVFSESIATYGSAGGIVAAMGTLIGDAFGAIKAGAAWVTTAASGLVTAIAEALATIPLLLPALTVGLAAGAVIVLLGDIGGEITRVLTGKDYLAGATGAQWEEGGGGWGDMYLDAIRKRNERREKNLFGLSAKQGEALRLDMFKSNVYSGQMGIPDYSNAVNPYLSQNIPMQPPAPDTTFAPIDMLNFEDMTPVQGITSGMAQTIIATLGEQSAALTTWNNFVETLNTDTSNLVLIFGEEGVLRMAWDAFTSKVTDDNVTLSDSLLTMVGNTKISFSNFVADATNTKKTWHKLTNAMQHDGHILADAITALAGSVNDLVSAVLVLDAIKLDMSNIAAREGVPGHASGGTATGWAVVGERGPELAYFGSKGTILPTHTLREAARGGGQTTSANVNIYSNDVDQILFELRRRGINL